jgi:transcriptional repressor NrdR
VYCPYCRHMDSRVIDSRTADDGAAIRRRRACPACGRRFTTQETVILTVAKRSGVTEPFNRDKIVRGVRRACQGRPVSEDQLALLAQQVEDVIRSRGSGEVPSHEVGLAILGPLRDLDEVAYLRFASVYRGFESLADFEEEIAALRAEHLNEAEHLTDWGLPEFQFLATEPGQNPSRERGTGPELPAGERASKQRGQEPAPAS